LRTSAGSTALAKALVAEARVGDADAVDVACRQTRRAREADVERVEVGAFAREVAGDEHHADVAEAAAARLRVAEGVLDDPSVDCARRRFVATLAAGDFLRRLFHDAVGR
jgi:hypothetical protein